MSDCPHDFAGCGCDTPDLEHEAREFAQLDDDTTVLRDLAAWDATQVPASLSDLRAGLTRDTREASTHHDLPGRSDGTGVAYPHSPQGRCATPPANPDLPEAA